MGRPLHYKEPTPEKTAPTAFSHYETATEKGCGGTFIRRAERCLPPLYNTSITRKSREFLPSFCQLSLGWSKRIGIEEERGGPNFPLSHRRCRPLKNVTLFHSSSGI